MDIILWYAISIASLAMLLLACLWLSPRCHFYALPEIQSQSKIRRPTPSTGRRVFNRAYIFILKNLIYAIFMERRYWNSITLLQAILISLYIAGNGVVMGIEVRNGSDLMMRSGKIALVNMIPLFLGGRRNFLAGQLEVPLHNFHLAHHCIGRMAILQGVLHAVLAIISDQPWHFEKRTVSGIAIGSILILMLFLSMYFVRRWIFEVFLATHLFLAMATISMLIWHILPDSPWNLVSLIAAPVIWCLTFFLRFFRSRRVIAILEGIPHTLDLKLRVCLPRGPKIRPGQYFYIQFSDMSFPFSTQSHPFMLTWLQRNELHFLIERKNGLTGAIRDNTTPRVTINGPYGRDLHLERYENVLLFAKGIGISGLLHYIQHLTQKKASNNCTTKRLNLYWFLEHNSQIEWVEDYFKALSKHKSLLAIQVYFPNKFREFPWQDKHFQCFHQEPNISLYMEDEASRDGRKIVAACGTADFTLRIRQAVLKAISEEVIEFVEVEYRPHTEPFRPRLQSEYFEDKENINQEAVPISRPRKIYIKSPLSEQYHASF